MKIHIKVDKGKMCRRLSRVRLGTIPATRAHSTKKGQKGYDRHEGKKVKDE